MKGWKQHVKEAISKLAWLRRAKVAILVCGGEEAQRLGCRRRRGQISYALTGSIPAPQAYGIWGRLFDGRTVGTGYSRNLSSSEMPFCVGTVGSQIYAGVKFQIQQALHL